jgi:hypothetical protein
MEVTKFEKWVGSQFECLFRIPGVYEACQNRER